MDTQALAKDDYDQALLLAIEGRHLDDYAGDARQPARGDPAQPRHGRLSYGATPKPSSTWA